MSETPILIIAGKTGARVNGPPRASGVATGVWRA